MQPIKHKIIKEYNKLVRNLNLGKISDYEHILQMISFTEIGEFICKNVRIWTKLH